jgi:hypothetical protein
MIHLVGPGGGGKSTVGLALAMRLGITFVDLDGQFTACAGDISDYLAAHGYDTYAARNIQVYLETLGSLKANAVIALSAGFMTYRDGVHSAYPGLRRDVAYSLSTVVLLPSFDYDTCVVETVRSIETVVDNLVNYLLPNIRLQPAAAGAIMGCHG